MARTVSTPTTSTPTTDEERATLVYVDPADLVVGANVRLDSRLDKEFIESIRGRGVLEPIVAYENGDGQLVVLYGQRRTLAAVQTEQPTVPVVVRSQPDETDRVVDQLAENDHREALTVKDRVAAYHQLSLLGLTAGEIAKKASTKREHVEAALTVSGSELGRAAVARYDFLTLDHAAAVAEFEGDGEAVKVLVAAARDGGFNHRLQLLRDDRDLAAERATLVAELTGQGIKVIDKLPYDHPKIKDLSYLKVGRKNATEANHRNCPDHAVYLREGRGPREGDGSGRQRRTWIQVYACTNYPKHGHSLQYPSISMATGRVKAVDMDAEERAAAAAARRDVVNSNKEWDSAETVRQAWLKQFAARKTPPKTAAAYIAKAIASCDHQIRGALEGSHKLARDLFGVEHETYQSDHRRGQLLADLCTTQARATIVTLVMILAAYEASLPRDAWRRNDPGATEYLRYIESEGYELSDVERRACGEQIQPAGQASEDPEGEETP